MQTIHEHTKPNRNKHPDTEIRVVVTRGEGIVGRTKLVKGINIINNGN